MPAGQKYAMKIVTGHSKLEQSGAAVMEAAEKVEASLNCPPDLVICYYTDGYDADELRQTLASVWPDAALHGGSTCRGVVLPRGWTSRDERVLALFALSDPEGAYGAGSACLDSDAGYASATAVRMALEHAGRPGELPALIWLSTAPGEEEKVLEGLESAVGRNVPVLGGSTADNYLHGRWSQFSKDKACTNGVVVSVLFPTVELGYSYHNGYLPTTRTGTVTRGSGRILYSINGKPAAEVYNHWTGGLLKDTMLQGGNILDKTSLFPLGRLHAWLENVPLYILFHPERVNEDKSLSLFASIREGETVALMRGNKESLVRRAGRVAESALAGLDEPPAEIKGGLVMFCAGSMLAIHQDIHDVYRSLGRVFGDAPYLCGFTFGEQGRLIDGSNQHGNLMISVVVFSDQEAVF